MSLAFQRVTGAIAPLLMDDVNTDFIIPIAHCVNRPRERMGDRAFEPARYLADGAENPAFVLNRPAFRGAPILLVGSNFGCGSSREPAVWALEGLGIRVVIATSFGGIFHSNCFRNGLLPIELPPAAHQALVALCTGPAPLVASVDLEQGVIALPGDRSIPFEIEPARRQALLQGLDDIGQTLLSLPEILAFQARDRQARPWVWEPVEGKHPNHPGDTP